MLNFLKAYVLSGLIYSPSFLSSEAPFSSFRKMVFALNYNDHTRNPCSNKCLIWKWNIVCIWFNHISWQSRIIFVPVRHISDDGWIVTGLIFIWKPLKHCFYVKNRDFHFKSPMTFNNKLPLLLLCPSIRIMLMQTGQRN